MTTTLFSSRTTPRRVLTLWAKSPVMLHNNLPRSFVLMRSLCSSVKIARGSSIGIVRVPSLRVPFHMCRSRGWQFFSGDIPTRHQQHVELMNLSPHLTTPTRPMFRKQEPLSSSMMKRPCTSLRSTGRRDVSYCFGNKPRFKGNGSPTGRATRVFTVYSPDLDKRVLMKGTWRVSLRDMQTEGAIYRRLHAAHVSHIPRFVRGGDVTSPFCRTRSHKFAKYFGLKLRPHSHYRFILDDIGRDLTSFATTR